MQKSRMQHRKAVTLDTAVWPFSDTRVDKLENDVHGIRSDVNDIKDSVDRLTGVKNVGDNGERDVDEDNTPDTSKDASVTNVMEKNEELTKLQTDIEEDDKQITETTKKFAREMHDLKMRHDAAMHQMQQSKKEKETHAQSLLEEIQESTSVHGAHMTGVSSNASQYCVNLTR
jgi:chromosome segregation ATPase